MLATLRRIVRSFGYAFEGVVAIARTQPNFLLHVLAAVLALGLSAALGLTPVELAVVTLTIFAVLAAEAFNTAIESLSDHVEPSVRPLIKRTKDAAAAGVLLTALGAVGVAACLFLPRLLALFAR